MNPIRRQILDVIGARLALIDEGSGYFTTLNKLERARLTPFDGYDLPAMNYWHDLDTLVGVGAGYEERELTVFVEYHAQTRDRPFPDVADELAADVEIALYRDVSAGDVTDQPSSALGGLVTGLRLQGSQPQIGVGQAPFCGVIMNYTISYKRRPDAPFDIVT